MSGFDYSKWDHIGDDDDGEIQSQQTRVTSQGLSQDSPSPLLPQNMSIKQDVPNSVEAARMQAMNASGSTVGSDGSLKPTPRSSKGKGRYKFEYEGRTIYEWEQSIDEVNIYIEPPPGVPTKLIYVDITHGHLRVGLEATPPIPPFIDEDTWGTCMLALYKPSYFANLVLVMNNCSNTSLRLVICDFPSLGSLVRYFFYFFPLYTENCTYIILRSY